MVNIKIYPEDKWFSLYIRARDKWTCQKCNRSYRPYEEGGDNTHLMGLHNAHCFGRGSHRTRWDERNCMALCYGCHSYIDSHPREKIKLWENKLGKDIVDELELLSNTPYSWKKDRKKMAKEFRFRFRELLALGDIM